MSLFSYESIYYPTIILNADGPTALDYGTLNFTRAAGFSGIKVISTAKVLLTGSAQSLDARINNNIATATGKIIGLKSYAANNQDAASLTIHGAEIWALTKGNDAATVRGMEVGLDFDGGETVTTAVGIRVVSQAGGTITKHAGIQTVDDSASTAGGRPFDAFYLAEKTATELPKSLLWADFAVWGGTSANGITLTSGDIPVLSYKDKDGTAHVLVCTDGDAVAIRT